MGCIQTRSAAWATQHGFWGLVLAPSFTSTSQLLLSFHLRGQNAWGCRPLNISEPIMKTPTPRLLLGLIINGLVFQSLLLKDSLTCSSRHLTGCTAGRWACVAGERVHLPYLSALGITVMLDLSGGKESRKLSLFCNALEYLNTWKLVCSLKYSPHNSPAWHLDNFLSQSISLLFFLSSLIWSYLLFICLFWTVYIFLEKFPFHSDFKFLRLE